MTRRRIRFSSTDLLLIANKRKRMEQIMETNEKTMAALFSAMTEMVVLHELVFDQQGSPVNYRITDCNAAFTHITGIPRDTAVGQLATDLYGADSPPYFAEFSQVALTGEPFYFETYYAPMGLYLSISVVSPSPNTFATISTDITSIKSIQKLLEAKNQELEQIVYVASHDLRSPLVNVEGYGRELEYSLADIKDALSVGGEGGLAATLEDELPDMTEAIHHVRKSTQQMDALLKGLLKLSRLGRSALNITTLDMNELIAGVLDTVDYQTRVAGITVTAHQLPPCRSDAVQVTQVFANLIGNAIKFRRKDVAGLIEITGAVDGNNAIYQVCDNGVGIAPEQREVVFELFHRLNPACGEGEGLGLTIARQCLNRVGGEIWATECPGGGTCFNVLLPQ